MITRPGAAIIANSYQTTAVRDLAWACFSPPLLHVDALDGSTPDIGACALQLTPARQRWLQALDQEPGALHEHLAQHPARRLGKYFEQLWHFFLRHDPATTLVAHNLPVHGRGRTLGEFDCIYYCAQRRRYIHLELAVKFYLGLHDTGAIPGRAPAQNWLGPDCRDRLDAKLAQLLQRQILLGDLPEAQAVLGAQGVTPPLLKEIALKGYLFWPGDDRLPPAPAYNAHCAHHRWLRWPELPAYCARIGANRMVVLRRLRWLSHARCTDPQESVTAVVLVARMAEHFAREPMPVLIAALDADGEERSRFFVTSEHWPHDRA